MEKLRTVKASILISEADIAGSAVSLTIANVARYPIGREQVGIWVLHFDESEKALALDVDKIATLAARFGTDRDRWIGQAVSLLRDTVSGRVRLERQCASPHHDAAGFGVPR